MGRRPKWTFLQRKHTDGQEAHEKMFNIFNYLRTQMNAKCIRMATTSKQKITSVAESVEKLGPFCPAAVKVRWISKPIEGNSTKVRQKKLQVHLV